MSLSSLKKSTQSDRPKLVTVDKFIDDAVAYANGAGTTATSRNVLKVVCGGEGAREKMRRATFTLNEVTIDALSELSERTGIAKSRLIRILVQRHMRKGNDSTILNSAVR